MPPIERRGSRYYTDVMPGPLFRSPRGRVRTICTAALTVVILTLAGEGGPAYGHSDVYASLPEDVEVISYATGDVDGDSLEELALLYLTGGLLRLTLFHASSGRWVRWWDHWQDTADDGGASLHSFAMLDANGDGFPDLAVYLRPASDEILITRLLTFTGAAVDKAGPSVLLEDFTSPPGYPIFGSDQGRPSVTFLNMGGERERPSGGAGYRRVYCWDRSEFERCLEVEWAIPGRGSSPTPARAGSSPGKGGGVSNPQ